MRQLQFQNYHFPQNNYTNPLHHRPNHTLKQILQDQYIHHFLHLQYLLHHQSQFVLLRHLQLRNKQMIQLLNFLYQHLLLRQTHYR
jgi:hypothetical protein